ncbi:MFS general substrate transporter [Fistulina hepatica ATCC 64428]|uniref:MFS general substrate transporter n=1 Tax=Fistulina hepatica ATCC 64428 TaxID=1128425 RepID=A0A0D7AJ55_9AGAR|nr:MFS general substrate transporter [Fistulina hepatica ATCC 64428]
MSNRVSAPPLPFKTILIVFLGLSLCICISALDSVTVATALPTISSVFNAGSISSWVPSAYLLTSTVFQPLYGRFSDIFGRKLSLCVGMSVFMIGNLAAGFSKNIITLIVLRGLAGTGGGGLVSLSQIVVSDIISLRERGKYQGLIGGVVALGYCLGPIMGGSLAENVGWQWCFWITVPITFFAMCVVIFVLPLKPVEGNMKSKLKVVDYLGSALTLASCSLLILPIVWGGVTFPWKSAVVLATLLSGILLVAAFCLWEWKGARLPIVPMYIFRHATVTGVYITMFANGFVFFSSLYYLPQFFEVCLGFTPTRGGTFLIPVLISQMIASWLSGLLVSITGRYRTIIHSGFTMSALGCGLLSTVHSTTPRIVMVVYMLLAGFGSGQTMQTTTVAAQASVPRHDMSVVTAFRNFIRQLGGTLALAIDSAVLNNSLRSSMRHLSLSSSIIDAVVDNPLALQTPAKLGLTSSQAAYILEHGYTAGFRSVFIMNAALAAVATIASITMIKHKELRRPDEEMLKKQRKDPTPTETTSVSGAGAADGVVDIEKGPVDSHHRQHGSVDDLELTKIDETDEKDESPV